MIKDFISLPMIDYTHSINDSDIFLKDLGGMVEKHASVETLNFLRLFARSFKPTLRLQ